ncbi:type 1 glutamine amidotransferase [bacterium]|nr:type 1 glutamine amidotransferase [bacterium]
MKVLIISANGFEDMELFYPIYRFREEEIEFDLASFKNERIRGMRGYMAEVTITLEDVKPEEYNLLFLPGGKAPQGLRKNHIVKEIARHFFQAEKPVAAICHGPQILISAELLKGRKATGYFKTRDELEEAGVEYLNQSVVVDGNLITSRNPADLPYFFREVINLLKDSSRNGKK